MERASPRALLACRDPDQQLLAVGHEAAQILSEASVPFLVGGGVALWAYGRRRNTKDIDLFLPVDKPIVALDALARRGFHTRDMDARWLYKAQKCDVTIDLILFTTGDIRVDAATFAHGRQVKLDGYSFTLMGPEDVLFRKILSASEERFHDWFDALSILARRDPTFDWEYFLALTRARTPLKTLSLLYFALAELGPAAFPPELFEELAEQALASPSVV